LISQGYECDSLNLPQNGSKDSPAETKIVDITQTDDEIGLHCIFQDRLLLFPIGIFRCGFYLGVYTNQKGKKTTTSIKYWRFKVFFFEYIKLS
jgi:hypothetical protein